jgi:hypothetical protein
MAGVRNMNSMQAIAKLFKNRAILKYVDEIGSMKDPELQIGKYKFMGKDWIMIMVREKDDQTR